MAQDPQENAQEPGAPSFSQDDIDALLQGGGGAASAGDADARTPASGGPQEVDQSDIDALFGGGGDSEASASGAATEPAAEAGDSGPVDQAAIDALLAGGGDAVASEEPAAAPEAAAAPDTRLDSMGRPFDEMAAAMAAAIEEEKAQAPAPAPAQLTLEDFGDEVPDQVDAKRVSMLNDVNLRVKIELGRTRMLVEEVLKLDVGSVVELERLAGDPVDVYVNDRLIARGEVLVLNDNFCVRVSEVSSGDPHRVST